MNYLYKYKTSLGTLLLLIIVMFAYGCEGILDKNPKGTLDANTLANKAGVEGALISTYRALDWNSATGGALQTIAVSNWAMGSMVTDDAYKGTEASDAASSTELELYNWSTGGVDILMNDAWNSRFDGVNRANATLELLASVRESNPGEISDADANSIRGEAIFLRAHFHFDLWKKFENIPYYTEEDEDFKKSNSGVDVVNNILTDLDEAISLLPETPRNGETGRVSSWVAKSYKGRVLMHAEQYQEALTVLRDVVNNGPYALEENFHQVWTGMSEYYNGPETIFAYQASSNDGDPLGNNANYGERLNFPHGGSPFGCCGFHQPSQNLVNFFKVDQDGLPVAMSNPAQVFDATATWNGQDEEFDATQNNVPVDPRLDWTVGRDGVPYKDWGEHEAGWIRQESFGGPYSPKKNVHEQASDAQSNVGWNNTHLNSVKMHILRYADVLLLLAEAEVEAGDLEAARQIINQIRSRAGVAAQGPGTGLETIAVPIDDASITWADYEVGLYPAGSFDNQEYARAAVRAERRLELAMEGTRLFDLRRWEIIEPVLNNYISVEQNRREYLTAAAQVTERYYRYPIPNVQIELSVVDGEQRLVQNPGW